VVLLLGYAADESDVTGGSADSWRARVTHISELQVNIYSGVMKIDFGGLDRWDYAERRRNIEEALSSVT